MAHLAAEGALDGFLADQLLLPLAFSNASSEYTTSLVSQHLLSNAQVVQAFTAARIEVDGGLGKAGRIKVTPLS
jgi:RNA 3'-terminal phosphate cyclase (ATP)